MTLELLWTDWGFFLVLIVSFILLIKGLRQEPFRNSIKQIFNKPLAASCFVIFSFFLIIGILDSLHYKTTQEIQAVSVLDRILNPLGEVYEKTYSQPLALNLFTSEVEIINKQAKQVYPRLSYPSAHFKSTKDVKIWVRHVLIVTILVCLGMLVICWYGFKFIRMRVNFAAVTALITFFVCIAIIMASYWISRELHLFGTGKIGQDIFYYAVKSIRTGLIIGILTTVSMMPLAIILGIAAGYFGGVIDDIIQYIYTTLSSIPGVLLITASVLAMQTFIANHPQQFASLMQAEDARLLALCLILGVTSWTNLCRLLRAETLKLREMDFILAATALGSSSIKIIRKHLLPNVMPIVLITLVLDFSFLVLAEAVLSYVGVGVSPLTMSWGNMINAARLELARDPLVWWPMLTAFIFMFILVLASNVFADAVRDAFDPRQVNV